MNEMKNNQSVVPENGMQSFREVATEKYLCPGEVTFREKDGFLTIEADGKTYPRVLLRRAFPFELPDEYITVTDGEGHEIGMIRSLSDLDAETGKLLREELARAYYMPEVTKILSMKERFGFSYWRVETGDGETEFTLQDTYRSIQHVTPTHLIFLDVSGNRFEIPDTEKLDRGSHRKIELYL